MFSLESFQKQYQTDTTEVVVDEHRFHLFVPKTIDSFIDPLDPLRNFPLWSKIWQASLVLADYLAHLPVHPDKQFLEIGSGMGLVSIVATHAGHNFTLTEYDLHALNFARANARLNKCPKLEIKRLDWFKPNLEEIFDYIVGSEVLYKKACFPPLLKLFKQSLKSDGEIILVGEPRKTDLTFYKMMDPSFRIKVQKKTLRSANIEIRVNQINMTFK
jgi:predicted nicotinamide N-methyase